MRLLHVDIHETIARPIDEVFARLIDIPGYSEWMPRRGMFIASRQDSEGPVGVGTRYTDRTRMGIVHGDVCAFERPTRLVFHYTARLFGRAWIEGWPGYTLEREGECATRVHHFGEARLYGPAAVLRPLVERIARGERRRTVDALKRALEA